MTTLQSTFIAPTSDRPIASSSIPRSASLHTPNRTRSKHGSISGMHEIRRTPLKGFLWEEDSAESPQLVAPDFHFPWMNEQGQHEDRSMGSRATPNGSRRTPSRSEDIEEKYRHLRLSPTLSKRIRPQSADATATPPDRILPRHQHTQSQNPSASSQRMGSLAEIPTTTPNKGTSTTPNSSGLGRTYGGNRVFSRVVSAPITMRQGRETDDSNTWASSARPALVSTGSSSSVNDHTDTTKTIKALGGDAQTTRSRFVTPGHTDRTIGALSTTGRRVHGLSRFGGPARRVVAPETGEEVLADPMSDSPNTASPANSSTTPQEEPRSFRLSPMSEDPEESRPLPANSSVHSLQGRRNSPDPDDKPFRPFQTLGGESGSSYRHSTPHKEISVQPARSPRAQARSPLAPARTIPAALPPSPQPIKASRPAPPIDFKPIHHPVQATVQPSAPAEPTQWNNTQTLVNPVPAPAKRSFIVNNNAYERITVLGKGGSSKVYSVLCANTRKVYALKRVMLDRADAETCQGYMNEIELLKRLRGHDRIIQLIDHQIIFSNNRPKVLNIVMECGEIDFSLLLDEQKGKMLNMNFVGLYWQQMLEAVHAVHLENVVHTDLKPANFVLVKGRLKIIDFGIAKAVANDTVNIQREQQVGTVNYMSPEAIQRMNNQKVLKVSYSSDVWSLGCILYQMIYGHTPFSSIPGGPLPKMNAIADPNHKITYPDTATPKGAAPDLAVAVNPAAIDTMRRCLCYNREQRLTIPELLHHEFLRPKIRESALPVGSTTLTRHQMSLLVDYVLQYNHLPTLAPGDTTAEDLFTQLEAQNSLTK
ncbi:kinase-like domain-containing protein [Kockovaella imperatae]|uniref:Kinase-like domain-containing protein n=1 Tax=Kockovaella imperatae TaxID=4999 RepID=A0A1Y1ULS5_9TREE|nr:kinase-like domain-containing protein [Kockovaella imperatae]ORX39001.1 kinase-like domain-containing protein [Kockovaella imperatae]